jgi:hypothetical protein
VLKSLPVLRPSAVSVCPAARLIAWRFAASVRSAASTIMYCVPAGSVVLAALMAAIAASSEPSLVTV